MDSLQSIDDRALMVRVLEHYKLVAPLIAASLAQTPIVFVNYPDGGDQDARFHVTTVPLTVDKLLWLIHAEYAVEFYTWAPTLLDTDRLRFGRLLIEAPPGVGFERVKLAALALRAILFDTAGLKSVPLLDGGTGIALWMPLADSPSADMLRKGLHALCEQAVAEHPDLVSTSYNTHHDGRVHLHVSSNAAGHYSAVPYSLRGQGMTVCAPIHWEELGSFAGADAFRCADIPARLRSNGDVFASEVKLIAEQRFSAGAARNPADDVRDPLSERTDPEQERIALHRFEGGQLRCPFCGVGQERSNLAIYAVAARTSPGYERFLWGCATCFSLHETDVTLDRMASVDAAMKWTNHVLSKPNYQHPQAVSSWLACLRGILGGAVDLPERLE